MRIAKYKSSHIMEEQKEVFKPHGAIAFFVLMVVLGLIIWFGVYAIMILRS